MKYLKKISEDIVADNWYRKIIHKIFDMGNGQKSDFLISSHYWKQEATIVLPVCSNGDIIYLKEFRYWPERIVISFPMGWVEENETIEENAKKELLEETWYFSDDIEYIGETIVANYERGISKYFIARNCKKTSNQKLNAEEQIEVFRTSVNNFEKMIKRWEVNCPLSISLFYFAKEKII